MNEIKNWLSIDGKFWDVAVLKIVENGNILYSENTGRTASKGARMTLDPLGTFIGHKITIKRKGDNFKAFDDLCNYIRIPRYGGVRIKAVDGQGVIEYDAYVSSYERECQRIDNDGRKVYWKEMELNFIPMEAQVLPL